MGNKQNKWKVGTCRVCNQKKVPLVPVDNINPGAPSKICVSCVDKMFDTVYNSRYKNEAELYRNSAAWNIGKCKRCKSKKVRLVPGLGIDLCVTCANELGYELAHNEWNARGLTRCILCGVNHACSKSFGRVCASCATTLYKVTQAEQHDRFREPKEVLCEIKDLAMETREKLTRMVNEKYPLSPHKLEQISDEFVFQYKTKGKNQKESDGY